MQKINLFFLLVVLLFGLIACSNLRGQGSNNEQSVVNSNEQDDKVDKKDDIREKVWEQLSSEQKERIDGTWKDGKESKIILNENMMAQISDKSYEGKEVYLIDFPIKRKAIPKNMIVYADKDTFEYIGNGLVD